MSNKIEAFFDNAAPSWDQKECCSDEIKLSLLKEAFIKKGDRVLDVASGTGVVTGLIHSLSDSEVVGIDISSKMIEIAKEKYKGKEWARFVHGDLFDLEDEKFNEIVIYNAYPHFLDPDKLADKCYSLLKEGGHLSILHSLSRAELDKHHSGKACCFSRSLEEPLKEAEHFAQFKLKTAREDDKSFVLVLEK